MKLKQSFVIILLMASLNLASGKKKDSVVPYAINAIIEQHFATLADFPGRVDIFLIGNDTLEFSELMNMLLKIKSANTKVTIQATNTADWKEFNYREFLEFQKFVKLGDSSIVFFDSVESFKAGASNISWVSQFGYHKNHLVYVPDLTTSDIIKTFVDGFEIDNVNFLECKTK